MSSTFTYIKQRVTGVLLIPLSFWFVFIFHSLFLSENRSKDAIENLYNSPLQSLSLVLFAGFGLYHGYLGINNIIDDYMDSGGLNKAMKIIMFLTSMLVFIALVVGLFFHGR